MTTIQQGLDPLASIRLTNNEYHYLYIQGGDGLVAFFATLRYTKKSTVIKKVGKKGPFAVIGNVTGLCRTTVNKYLTQLLALDMAEVHPNGNIALRSRKWADKNLPRMKNRKLIPIEVCKKFTDTKTSIKFVRVHSNIKKQKSQIGKKAERIELIKQLHTGRINNLHDLKRAKSLVKKGYSYESLKADYRLNSTLSNLGFDKLNKNTENDIECNKSSGNYLKSKLLKRGLLIQNRQVVLAYPNVKDFTFLEQLRADEYSGGHFIGKKGIYFEDSPIIELGIVAIVGSKKKQVEK